MLRLEDAVGKTPKQTTDKEIAIREAKKFRNILQKNKQIGPDGKPLDAGVTHVEKLDDKGNSLLVRKRFSAI